MKRIAHRAFKDELYGEFARIGAALASPKRLEILDLLAQRERSVEDLAAELGLSVANASQHLRILAAARLTATRRVGTFVHYRLASPSVFKLFGSLRDLATERLPEVSAAVERHLGSRRNKPAPSPREALRRTRKNEVVLLDVRPPEEFAAGHLPGARSMPLASMSRQDALASLPRRRELVVYCRGPYCVWADEAVDLLTRRGFMARRLLVGPPDWAALGEELESEAS
jgi:DNA-binding transcriptional ArsR family regulator/rhodanese-related sulfurtransferase